MLTSDSNKKHSMRNKLLYFALCFHSPLLMLTETRRNAFRNYFCFHLTNVRVQLQRAKVFLGCPLVTNSFCCNAAWRAMVEITYAPTTYFMLSLLSDWVMVTRTSVCTWARVQCLSTFPGAGFGSVLRSMCGPWIMVLEKKTWDKIEFGVFFPSLKKQS